MSIPIISTIVPVYNTAPYLRRCVDSILSQDFENLEIILVDDGSTDGSSELCDELARQDSRIRVIHKTNGGVSSARNVGLDSARGEWVHFADSDDFWGGVFYKSLYDSVLRSGADLGVCTSCIEKTGGVFQRNNSTMQEQVIGREKAICELLKTTDISYSLCDKLFKRSVIGDLRFNTRISHNEDFLFCYEYLKRCDKIYFTPTPYYYYCYNATSAVRSNFSHKNMTAIDAQEIVLQDIDENFPEITNLARTQFCKVLLYTASAISNSGYNDKSDRKRIRGLIKRNLIHILQSDLALGYKYRAIAISLGWSVFKHVV